MLPQGTGQLNRCTHTPEVHKHNVCSLIAFMYPEDTTRGNMHSA